jgi:hypothetical protein
MPFKEGTRTYSHFNCFTVAGYGSNQRLFLGGIAAYSYSVATLI